MLRGGEVTLRAVEREDLECLWRFANDLEVELAGGGDPPQPRSFESFQADFEKETRERAPDKINFAIEVDGVCIGTCGLFGLDATARHAEFGIGIGEKELWGTVTGGRQLVCSWTMLSAYGTWSGCGWRSTQRTSVRYAPTELAASSKRAECGGTFGSPGDT